MKLYKLTDQDGFTRNDTWWGTNVSHAAKGRPDQPLCSDGWIHAYEHPYLAVLLNPIQANILNPMLWEAQGEVGIREGQLKCGCRKLTTIKQIPLPVFTRDQKVAFAILSAKKVCNEPKWTEWADEWLDGSDRTIRTAMCAVITAKYNKALLATSHLAAISAAHAAGMLGSYIEITWAGDAAQHAVIQAAAKSIKIDLIACAEEALTIRLSL